MRRPHRRFWQRSSPHTRRDFLDIDSVAVAEILFSAHAEVFPPLTLAPAFLTSLLRTRGGISPRNNG